jgi:hypothetical protein
LITECDVQIAQHNFLAMPVEDRHESPDRLREMKARLARKQRD